MQLDCALDTVKRWIDPPRPGAGKNPMLGFALGVLFGALGVGIYLRSIAQGLICYAVGILAATLIGSFELFITWLACGLWCAGRIWWDNRHTEAQASEDVEPSSANDAAGAARG